MKALRLFGRINGFRWQLWENDNDAKDFARIVADSFTRDVVLTQEMLRGRPLFSIQADPVRSCWTLVHFSIGEFAEPVTEWTRELWDYYQAIAQHLLAMPMPT